MAWHNYGSISLPGGSDVVTGVNSKFLSGPTLVQPGHALVIPLHAGGVDVFEVKHVASDTSLTVSRVNNGPAILNASYSIDVTADNSYAELSRRASMVMFGYQKYLDSWQQILTGYGYVDIEAPDGTKVRMPSMRLIGETVQLESGIVVLVD